MEMQYKIVLDVVQAESGVTNLNQDLTTTKQKVDQVNQSNLNSLAKNFDKAAKSAKDLSSNVTTAANSSLQLGDTMTDTFQNALSSLDGVTPGVKEMANQLNGAIPIIKSLNKTATAGLSGIKKAIISTGIGALVVAVGMLAANWDKVTAAVKKFTQSATFSNITNWLKEFSQKLKDLRDKILGGIAGIFNAIRNAGTSLFKAALKAFKLDLKGAGEELANAINFKKAFQEGSDAAVEVIHKVDDFASGVVTKISDKVKANREREHKATLDDLNKEYESARQKEDRLHKERLQHLKELLDQRKITEKEYQDYVQKENKRYQEALAKSNKSTSTQTKSTEEIKEQIKITKDFQTLTESLINVLPSQLNKATDEAKAAFTVLYKAWDLNKQGAATKISDTVTESEELNEALNKAFGTNNFLPAETALEKIKVLLDEGIIKTDDWLGIVKSLVNGEVVEADHIQDQLKVSKEYLNTQRQLTTSKLAQAEIDDKLAENEKATYKLRIDTIQKQIDLYTKYNTTGEFTEDIFKLKDALQQLNLEYQLLETKQSTSKTLKAGELINSIVPKDALAELDKAYQDQINLIDYYVKQGVLTVEQGELLKTEATKKYSEDRKALLKSEAEEWLDAFQSSIEAAQTSIDNILSIGDGLSSKWGDAFAVLHQGFNQVALDLKTGTKDWEDWANNAATAMGFTSTVLNALADEQDTSTKEGFEKQKKLQKASVIFSGLQGSVAAISNAIRDLGFVGGVGPAVGAAMSAMILALTAKQVQAINNTSFDGSDTSTLSSGTSLSATPILSGVNESLPTSTVVTNQDDQRVYILQSDLTKSSKQVQVREANTTF